MAFALRSKRPLPDQLRRIVRKELHGARQEIATGEPTQRAIHEARKGLKKARAVLRLLEGPLDSHYEREKKRLHVAAHALASLRDVDAAVETLKSLKGRYKTVVTPTIARAVTRGMERRRRSARAHAGPALGRAREALAQAEKSAPKRVQQVGDFEAVRSGVVGAYHRAQKALGDLTLDGDAALFHACRKRVKDLMYFMQLFAGLHRAPRARVETLDRLETMLGEDHDLAVLKETILVAPVLYGGPRAATVVLGAIDRRRIVLRRHALRLGARTFAAPSKEFDAAVITWWKDR